MTWPNLSDMLTPDRLAHLRVLVSGDKRDANGVPFKPNRSRLRWFARHGYIVLGPALEPDPSGRRKKAAREFTVTDKARAAVKERKTA